MTAIISKPSRKQSCNQRKKSTILLSFTLLALFIIQSASFSVLANQQNNTKKVYAYKDKQGNVVFTDKAKAGAEVVDIRQNTMTMPAIDTGIITNTETAAAPTKHKLTITSPVAEQSIRSNQGIIDITARVTPTKLPADYQFRLKLDGQIKQKPHANPHFVLRDVDRGEHTVVLELINGVNKVIATSDPVTFYLFRTSVLHNRSQNE